MEQSLSKKTGNNNTIKQAEELFWKSCSDLGLGSSSRRETTESPCSLITLGQLTDFTVAPDVIYKGNNISLYYTQRE